MVMRHQVFASDQIEISGFCRQWERGGGVGISKDVISVCMYVRLCVTRVGSASGR